MPAIEKIITRGEPVLFTRDDSQLASGDKLINLLIVFMALLFLALFLAAALIIIRRSRRQRQHLLDEPPAYDGIRRTSNHRRLTIQTNRQSILVFGKDGQPMLSNPNSPPHSPDNVPQIHITFPDETDDQGRLKSGRVVVVRVGDTSVGLEPVKDEPLPAYEKESGAGFYSIDMDEIGGLKEKDRSQFV